MRAIMLLVAIATAGCAAPPTAPPAGPAPAPLPSAAIEPPTAPAEEWAFVAACAGIDRITQFHVANLLRGEGIDSMAEGSMLYGISVAESDVERARGVLLASARPDVFSCHMVRLADDAPEMMMVGWERPAHGAVTTPAMPVAEFRARPGLDPRIAAALADRHVVDLQSRLPFVGRVEAWERPYLDATSTWRSGATIHVRLVERLGDSSGSHFQFGFQVSDPAAPIEGPGLAMFQGGHGAGPRLRDEPASDDR